MKPAPATHVKRLGVPILVDSPTRRRHTVFAVWNGEPGHYVEPPRPPGFWSVNADGATESRKLRRFSDTSAPPTMWHRLTFRTDKEARGYARELEMEGQGSYLGDVDRLATRVLVEHPDFFRELPTERPLRILTYDIEQYTDGKGFPPRKNPMVSVAFGRADGTLPEVFVAPEGSDGMPDDGPLVDEFKRRIKEEDPDVIVAFNAAFDNNVMRVRATEHGYPLEEWGRLDELGERARSVVREEKNGLFRDDIVYVGGRIMWDVRRNANPISDYNLSGCKDFTLKTIADWLGLPVIKENTTDTAELWRDRPDDLRRYNVNDVVLVDYLVNRYLPDRVGMAEFFGAPLDMTIDVGSGWAGTIGSARVLYDEGIVSDGTNFDRHEDFFTGPASSFEAAHTAHYKRGLFAPVHHSDFASLYPNVAIAMGIGPDNTRIVGTIPRGSDPDDLAPFAVERDEDGYTLHVPDRNFNHTWIIRVEGESTFSALVEARMKERLAAKDAGDKTRANILKTLLNSMSFGVHGALFNRYGSLAVAIATVGFARVLIGALEKAIGDSKIETDTDGVYHERRVPRALLNRAANKTAERYGFEPCFKVDCNQYPAAWFHKTKAYLLLQEDGKVKRVGVAMKGRSHPALFDTIIEDVGRALLTEGREAALEEAKASLDFDRYTPRDFVQRATLNKPIEAYSTRTKEVKIAEAYHAEYGLPPKAGTSYEYVRTRSGMVPPTKANLDKLDVHAYLTRVVLPALERLGFTAEDLGVVSKVKHLKARTKRPKQETSLSNFT